mgnify:CR=1 FL=1
MGVGMAPASEIVVGLISVKLAVDVELDADDDDRSGAIILFALMLDDDDKLAGNRTGIDVESELDDRDVGNKLIGVAAVAAPIIEPLVVCGLDTVDAN